MGYQHQNRCWTRRAILRWDERRRDHGKANGTTRPELPGIRSVRGRWAARRQVSRRGDVHLRESHAADAQAEPALRAGGRNAAQALASRTRALRRGAGSSDCIRSDIPSASVFPCRSPCPTPSPSCRCPRPAHPRDDVGGRERDGPRESPWRATLEIALAVAPVDSVHAHAGVVRHLVRSHPRRDGDGLAHLSHRAHLQTQAASATRVVQRAARNASDGTRLAATSTAGKAARASPTTAATCAHGLIAARLICVLLWTRPLLHLAVEGPFFFRFRPSARHGTARRVMLALRQGEERFRYARDFGGVASAGGTVAGARFLHPNRIRGRRPLVDFLVRGGDSNAKGL